MNEVKMAKAITIYIEDWMYEKLKEFEVDITLSVNDFLQSLIDDLDTIEQYHKKEKE